MIATRSMGRFRGAIVGWSHALIALLSSVFSGTAVAALTNAFARRRLARAEAADALADSAIDLLNAFKADARADLATWRADTADARREAAEARRETAELRQSVRLLTREAEELATYLQRLTLAIHDPSMTMERLRVLVGSGPLSNGQTRLRTSEGS